MSALYSCLAPLISSLKFLFCIILPMPSCQFLLGLPGFFFHEGLQFITCFGVPVLGILCTCPNRMSCLFISSTIVCVTRIISPIRSFVTFSSLFFPEIHLWSFQHSLRCLFDWPHSTAVCDYTFYYDVLLLFMFLS